MCAWHVTGRGCGGGEWTLCGGEPTCAVEQASSPDRRENYPAVISKQASTKRAHNSSHFDRMPCTCNQRTILHPTQSRPRVVSLLSQVQNFHHMKNQVHLLSPVDSDITGLASNVNLPIPSHWNIGHARTATNAEETIQQTVRVAHSQRFPRTLLLVLLKHSTALLG